MVAAEVKTCPRCSSGLARLAEEPPWCPECEWNLEDRGARRGKPLKARQLRALRRAFDINADLLAEFAGSLPERPKATRSRLILAAASLALLLFDLALVAVGGLLLIAAPFNLKVVGGVLLLIGIECRMRFPEIDTRIGQVAASDAPALTDLIEAARRTLGAPKIDVLLVSSEWNAMCGRSGLRRRTSTRGSRPHAVGAEPGRCHRDAAVAQPSRSST